MEPQTSISAGELATAPSHLVQTSGHNDVQCHFPEALTALCDGRKFDVLDAGVGPRRCLDITPQLAKIARAPIHFLERNEGRRASAQRRMGEQLEIFPADLSRYCTASQYDLVYVDVLPASLLAFFRDTFHIATSLLRPNGILILNLPVSCSVAEQNSPPPDGRDELMCFQNAMGSTTISVGELEARLRLQIVEICPGMNAPASGFGYQTFFIRNPSHSCVRSVFPVAHAQRFCFDMTMDFLARLRRRASIVPLSMFVEAKRMRRPLIGDRPVHFLKHDIHRDLAGTLRLARAEAEIGIRGAYFAMHDHELSKSYFDRKEMDEVLLAIQGCGHEIGLHVDAIDLIRSGVGLMEGVGAFARRLRRIGLRIACANSHGNTAFQHAWYNSTMVFREKVPDLNGAKIGPELGGLLGVASLQELHQALGIEYWVDSTIHYRGQRVPSDEIQVSDNFKSIQVFRILDEGREYETLFTGERWSIDGDTASRVIELTERGTCMYLFHPQFYL